MKLKALALLSVATVVIAGSVDRGDRTIGTVWSSNDAAATFVEADDAVLSARTSIGAPIVGGDGFIATASSPGTEPTVLVTSADGATWRAIDLSVTGLNNQTKSLSDAGSFGIVPFADGYAVGLKDLLASVATVDPATAQAGTCGASDSAMSPTVRRLSTSARTEPLAIEVGAVKRS